MCASKGGSAQTYNKSAAVSLPLSLRVGWQNLRASALFRQSEREARDRAWSGRCMVGMRGEERLTTCAPGAQHSPRRRGFEGSPAPPMQKVIYILPDAMIRIRCTATSAAARALG